jgi:ketosteroid isomerase-like protein/outer membrane murein-binding lipoprotein Lpp
MRLITLTIFAIATFLIAGCAPPANTNVATNTNTNANAKPAAAAPTVDALMAMDKAAQEAWAKGDTKWFQDNLSSKFVMNPMGHRMDKAEVVKMIGSNKCDIKSMNFTEPALLKVNDDTYVLSYKGTYDGSCTMDGKTEKLPAETRSSTVVIREGDKWMGAWHGETAIIDPKSPPPPPAPKKEEPKPAANSNASNSNSSSNAAASEAPKATPSANTDALVKNHQAGWEAFKAKDAKWFNDHLAENFGLVDPIGTYVGSKADSIKRWTETMKCEGVTTVKVSDGFSTALSPTVEILTLKGSADGTCDGQKNGDLYQTAVYVKEGDTWKLAYMMESPAMGM